MKKQLDYFVNEEKQLLMKESIIDTGNFKFDCN